MSKTDIMKEENWIVAQNPDWKLKHDGKDIELAVAIELMDTREAGLDERDEFWMLPQIVVQPEFFGPEAVAEIKHQTNRDYDPDIFDALYILHGAEIHWQVYVTMVMRGLDKKEFPGITWTESNNGPWVAAKDEETAVKYVKEVMLPFIEELMQIDSSVETMLDFPFNQIGTLTWDMLDYLLD